MRKINAEGEGPTYLALEESFCEAHESDLLLEEVRIGQQRGLLLQLVLMLSDQALVPAHTKEERGQQSLCNSRAATTHECLPGIRLCFSPGSPLCASSAISSSPSEHPIPLLEPTILSHTLLRLSALFSTCNLSPSHLPPLFANPPSSSSPWNLLSVLSRRDALGDVPGIECTQQLRQPSELGRLQGGDNL